MKVKAYLVLLPLYLFTTLSTSSPLQPMYTPEYYNNLANAWVNAYVFNQAGQQLISPSDMQMVANLMYFSYRRSQDTLRAQAAALRALESTWQSWQNITKRRLNPSHQAPYAIGFDQQQSVFSACCYANEHFDTTCHTYSKIVHDIVHGNALFHDAARDGVGAMRNQARKAMLDALADVKYHLGNLYNYAFGKRTQGLDEKINTGRKNLQNALNQLYDEAYQHINNAQVDRRMNLNDFLLSYVPQLAIGTFVEADRMHNVVADESWHILKTIIDIGTQVWAAIEQARSAFYQAHYTELYKTMRALDLSDQQFLIRYDREGLMPLDKPTMVLPSPETLS